MYLKQLHYFVTVADTGSFTKAAATHYIVQTSMSQQISSLERELGVQLFSRTTRRVKLTDAGRAFYDEIKPLVIKLDDTISSVKRMQDSSFTTLKIGIDQQINVDSVVPVIREYSQKHPDVRIQVMVDMVSRLFETLSSNSCDIVITGQDTRSDDRNYMETVIGSEPSNLLSVVVPLHSGWESRSLLSWEDIGEENVFIYSSMPDPISDHRTKLMIDSRLQSPAATVGSMESLRVVVSAGLGIGLIPRQMRSRIGYGVLVMDMAEDNILYENTVAYTVKSSQKREISDFLALFQPGERKPEEFEPLSKHEEPEPLP